MPHVSPATRERVQAVIQEVGFRPNMTARQLAGQSSNTVGLVTFATSFYGPAQILANCEQASKEMGLSFMFSSIVDQSSPEIRRAVNELCAHQVCGILLYLPLRIDLRDLQDVFRNVVIVAVDSNLGYKCPAIYINQELGSRIATQHLIQLGHRKIAYLQGPLFWRAAELRFKGWLKELKAAGLNPGPVISGSWTAESGFEATQKLITQHWGKYSALVAANDQMALGAIRAFEESGIQIPRTISVVGFDDIPEAAYFRPPLSTIKQDFALLASSSVECLMTQLNQNKPGRIRTIRPALVGRESSAAPGKRMVRVTVAK
jgi:DNA-binding LacI/PurR family transcriptional regulator